MLPTVLNCGMRRIFGSDDMVLGHHTITQLYERLCEVIKRNKLLALARFPANGPLLCFCQNSGFILTKQTVKILGILFNNWDTICTAEKFFHLHKVMGLVIVSQIFVREDTHFFMVRTPAPDLIVVAHIYLVFRYILWFFSFLMVGGFYLPHNPPPHPLIKLIIFVCVLTKLCILRVNLFLEICMNVLVVVKINQMQQWSTFQK